MFETLRTLIVEKASLFENFENSRTSLQGEFDEDEMKTITNFFCKNSKNLQV